MSDPVLVTVIRGGIAESRHRGVIALVDSRGHLVRALGNVEDPVFPRSANKPLQALPLVFSGGADHFGLGAAELSLACASHIGEPIHTEGVASWLARIGLTEAALECGPQLPNHTATAHDLIRRGIAPGQIHNNCSGKHTGFLTGAVHAGEDPAGYTDPDHPAMRRITQALSVMYGVDCFTAPTGIDGCSVPTIAVPLVSLAYAMARMADPDRLPAEFAAASRRIYDAIVAEPVLMSGHGEFTTAANEALAGRAIVKIGAEAVFTGAIRATGQGFAIKISDGGVRAVEIACAHLLDRLDLLDEAGRAHLDPWLTGAIHNRRGLLTGHFQAAAALRF